MTKAANGFWHSFALTTGRFPEPLRIKPHNRAITEEACRRCHAEIVEAIDRRGPAGAGGTAAGARAPLRCVGCPSPEPSRPRGRRLLLLVGGVAVLAPRRSATTTSRARS